MPTLTAKRPTRGSGARAKPRPSLGGVVCRWIEANLVHAEGDFYGEPIRLRDWQRELIYRAYELYPDGARVYNRALWGFPKGNGKTELAAMIACAEFAGPVSFAGWKDDGSPIGQARLSPDIPVAAASFEQADLLFGACRSMIRGGALREECEVYDVEILFKERPGRLYRVAAIAGTNDGGKPTFWAGDELHEWTLKKERVYLVLSNNRAKRKDAWQLAITTAGWDMTSLLGKLYAHGKKVQAGEVKDPGFLFVWFEAPKDCPLGTPKELEAAVRAANPAIEDFLSLKSVMGRHAESPEFEFRRYHLNQFVSAPERWLPVGAWDARAKLGRVVPDRTTVMLGFDGSYAGDSTALMGETLDRHLFVIQAWEKPEDGGPDWRVDILDVEQAIRNACQRWDVRAIGCDPYRWQRSLAVLLEEGLPVVEWPSHQASHMVPACAQFYEGVTNGLLTHDGDERLAKHVANCVVKIDSRGPRIVKDHKDSERHIDLAVASVIVDDLVVRQQGGGGFSFAGFNMEMR